MRLDNILVIAGRGDPEQPALRAARDLLPADTGRLHVAGFVYEQAAEEPAVLSAAAAVALRDALLATEQQRLNSGTAALALGSERLRVEAVWAKDIVDWIVDTVSHDRVSLVVKDADRSKSLFYTPVDWQLLRRSPVPVLVIGRRLRKKNRRILAAIDAASTHPVQIGLNRKVLAAATRLGFQLKAASYAAHVVAVSTMARDLDLIDADAVEREQRAKLGPPLTALAAEYGISPENIVIKMGSPDRVLVSIAAELKADIVVMGTVGRTGLAGKLLGNTAEQVLQRLRTSMLAVQPG